MALPPIHADLIQHKGLFKYYITHFLTVLDVHPPPVTVFFSINRKKMTVTNLKHKTVTGTGGHLKLLKNVLCNI